MSLSTAIDNFLQYHKGKGSRDKTIQSYHSKLKLFLAHLGNVQVNDISDYHITDYLNSMEIKKAWTGVTYNFARITLNNLFVYLKRYFLITPFLTIVFIGWVVYHTLIKRDMVEHRNALYGDLIFLSLWIIIYVGVAYWI